MDLQSTLVSVTRLILKKKFAQIRVRIERPSPITLSRWIVLIRVRFDHQHPFWNGTGGSSSLIDAYLRALGELCETLTMMENGFPSRCGMASGLIASNTISRAKAELIERDAFLYHYRNRIPFLASKSLPDQLVLFELSPADSRFTCVLVTHQKTIEGLEKCLKFGCSAHERDLKEATNKAIQEYVHIEFNHAHFPERCQEWEKNPQIIPTVMDFHHVRSRDPRNQEIFGKLFKTGNQIRKKIDPRLWKITELKSPARFFKVFRVDHPELLKLEFGKPEPGTENLFHPFW